MVSKSGMGRRGLSRLLTLSASCGIVAALSARVASAASITAQWTSPVSGNWTDGTKWSTTPNYPNNGAPAGTTYNAVIDAPGGPYTVTYSGFVTIDSLMLNAASATVFQTSTGTLQVNGPFALSAGTWQMSQGKLLFNGAQTISGSGQILLTASGTSQIAPTAATTSSLTIASGVTIKTSGSGGIVASIGDATRPLINQGVISSETAGGSLTVQGLNWMNTGTMKLSAGGLFLNGSTTTANLGTIQNTGGNLYLQGTLDNTGSTLDLANTGTLNLYNNTSTIVGGTITSSNPNAILRTNDGLNGGSGGTLNAVTLATDLVNTSQFTDSQVVNFANGLTLQNHNVLMTIGGKLLGGTSTQTLAGTGEIIVNDASNTSNFTSIIGGSNITIASGITLRTGATATNSFSRVNVQMAINHGTISAQTASLPVNIIDTPWTSDGTIKVSANLLTLGNTWTNNSQIIGTGGTLALTGTWTNNGTITLTSTGLKIGGTPTTFGAISMNGGNLDVAGSFTIAQIRQITTSGVVSLGTVPGGILDNTGATIALGATTGDLRLGGGTLKGGTITTSGTQKVNATISTTIQGVILAAPMSATNAFIGTTDLTNQAAITLSTSGGSGGGISLAGNWSNTGSITASGTNTIVQLKSTSSAMGSLNLSSAAVEVYAPYTTAQLNTIAATASTFRLSSGGSIDNTGATLTASGNRKWAFQSGAVTGGTLNSSDGTHFVIAPSGSGGTFSLVLDNVTVANATVDVENGVGPTIHNSLTLNNGLFTLGATPFGEGYLYSEGNATITGVGEINLQGDRGSMAAISPLSGTLTLNTNIFAHNGANNATIGSLVAGLNNKGLISSPTAGKTLLVQGAPLLNQGTLQATGGTLTLAGTWSNTGTISETSSTLNLGGNFTTAGMGTIARSAGNVNLTGSLDNSSATLATNSTTGSWNLAGGTVTGGTLATNNSTVFTATIGNSTLDGVSNTGAVAVNNGATLTLTGAWSNSGTITAAPGGKIIFAGAPLGTSLGTISLSSATLNIASSYTTQQLRGLTLTNAAVQVTPGGVVSNAGDTLALNAGTGSWTLAGGTLTGGTIAATSPYQLNAIGGANPSVIENITLAAPLSLTGGATVTARSGVTLATGGSINISNLTSYLFFEGTQTLGGNGDVVFVSGGANLQVQSGANLTVGSGVTIRTGGTGGYINLYAPITLNGMISSQTPGSQLSIPIFTTGRPLTVNGTLEAKNGGTLNISLGSLANYSNGTLTGGSYRVFANSYLSLGSSRDTAQIVTNNADVLVSGVGATFNDASFFVTNTGSFTITDGATLTRLIPGGSLSNAGTLTVGPSSTLTINDQVGNTTVPGKLSNSGALIGSGTIAATVTNSGTLSPGNSPGRMTISNGYNQLAGGSLNIELAGNTAGTQYDVLDVLGLASIAGTLNISLLNGFTPGPGDSFTFLNYASRSGTFSAINSPIPFDISYGATSTSVTFIPEPATMSAILGLGSATILGRRRRKRS